MKRGQHFSCLPRFSLGPVSCRGHRICNKHVPTHSHSPKSTYVHCIHTHPDRHTSINATRFSLQLANAFVGAGNQLYIGFGGAAFIRTYSLSRRRLQYNPSTPFTYTIAGMGVGSKQTRGQNLVVFKNGWTQYIFNKTEGSVTKVVQEKRQKTPSPTKVPGARRRALSQKRKVQASDIRPDIAPSMGKTALSRPCLPVCLSTSDCIYDVSFFY